MSKSKLTARLTNKAESLPPSQANACDSLVSTSTKASGAKDAALAQAESGNDALAKRQAVSEFFLKLYDQKRPGADDLRRLREQIVATPECWPLFFPGATDGNRETIINRLYGTEVTRTLAFAEMDVLKRQMGYESAPVLERMHIDHVLTAWLRLRDAEMQFTHCMSGEGVSLATAQFRQGFLESAQSRFLRASEALERIRRLARNIPALQINIAHDGGKQVNIQSDASVSDAKTAK
jgi:hypothetical protein